MTINCGGSLLFFHVPKIMGIVNITPDSFYDGGKFKSEKEILRHVEHLLSHGSDFIDIGGCSTRPWSKSYPTKEEEIRRVIPTIRSILKEFPKSIISIDTFHSEVAKIAVEEGALIINDISGGDIDKQMFPLLSKLRIPYILSHNNMMGEINNRKCREDNTLLKINLFFSRKIFFLKKYGVNDIILDPGFGFGKTLKQNYQLLKNLSLLGFKDHVILVGISRKSMIRNILKITTEEALNASSVVHSLALLNGAKILRVHDVKEAIECIKLIRVYQKS
ncbi:dihydropteroate synthase [Blattabacterium cuenoti]|uniref:dihydropteroate synthase n=1 Tax=Blattabacterium cuenoti TaxID=1653831 RepID=UPI00163C0E0E|nr:dihydropteroate synthase [Blattabacterium cuenoti]